MKSLRGQGLGTVPSLPKQQDTVPSKCQSPWASGGDGTPDAPGAWEICPGRPGHQAGSACTSLGSWSKGRPLCLQVLEKTEHAPQQMKRRRARNPTQWGAVPSPAQGFRVGGHCPGTGAPTRCGRPRQTAQALAHGRWAESEAAERIEPLPVWWPVHRLQCVLTEQGAPSPRFPAQLQRRPL